MSNGNRYVIDIDGEKNVMMKNYNKGDEMESHYQRGQLIINDRDIDMMYLDYNDSNALRISMNNGSLIIMQDSEAAKRILGDYAPPH